MSKAMSKIKASWEDNPLLVIGIGIAAVTALSKFIDSVSAATGRRAYARQVNHRVKGR